VRLDGRRDEDDVTVASGPCTLLRVGDLRRFLARCTETGVGDDVPLHGEASRSGYLTEVTTRPRT
jgi:hypothetical protein